MALYICQTCDSVHDDTEPACTPMVVTFGIGSKNPALKSLVIEAADIRAALATATVTAERDALALEVSYLPTREEELQWRAESAEMRNERDSALAANAAFHAWFDVTIEELAATRAERDRLRKLFDDAGQGEHNVLALIDYYQAEEEKACQERDKLRHWEHVAGHCTDRLMTIADEAFGMQPTCGPEESMTRIERGIASLCAERDALAARLKECDEDATDVWFAIRYRCGKSAESDVEDEVEQRKALRTASKETGNG